MEVTVSIQAGRLFLRPLGDRAEPGFDAARARNKAPLALMRTALPVIYAELYTLRPPLEAITLERAAGSRKSEEFPPISARGLFERRKSVAVLH
jgi:hypothetical protein